MRILQRQLLALDKFEVRLICYGEAPMVPVKQGNLYIYKEFLDKPPVAERVSAPDLYVPLLEVATAYDIPDKDIRAAYQNPYQASVTDSSRVLWQHTTAAALNFNAELSKICSEMIVTESEYLKDWRAVERVLITYDEVPHRLDYPNRLNRRLEMTTFNEYGFLTVMKPRHKKSNRPEGPSEGCII